ncbi:MAG: hypothetical protein CMM61_08655 [Rhodospirillaceae bacterium]|nr:hypothetical protein [Rhodospirillaceae bacterium]
MRPFRDQKDVLIFRRSANFLGVVEFPLSGFAIFVDINRLNMNGSTTVVDESEVGKMTTFEAVKIAFDVAFILLVSCIFFAIANQIMERAVSSACDMFPSFDLLKVVPDTFQFLPRCFIAFPLDNAVAEFSRLRSWQDKDRGFYGFWKGP